MKVSFLKSHPFHCFRIVLSLCFLLITWIASAAESAAVGMPSEYEVKAAFIYNLARFTEWPDPNNVNNESDCIVIGIVGEDPFGPTIERVIGGKTVSGRTIEIRRYPHIQAIDSCDILYVSASMNGKLDEILTLAKDRHILTVGDYLDFTQSGGMIRFFFEQNRIRFAINIDAVEDADLKISSKLLNLAKIVHLKNESFE